MAPQPSSPISTHHQDDYGFPDPASLGRASAANTNYAAASSPTSAHQANFASGGPALPGHPYANAYPVSSPLGPADHAIYQTPAHAPAAAGFYPADAHGQMMAAGAGAPPPEMRVMTHSPPPQLQQLHLSQQVYPQQYYHQPQEYQPQQAAGAPEAFHAISTPALVLAAPAPVYTPQPAEQQFQSMAAPIQQPQQQAHSKKTLAPAAAAGPGRQSVYDMDDAYGGM